MSDSAIATPVENADAVDVVQASSNNLSQIVSFRLANEEYGVHIMCVQEIILPSDITVVPQVAEHICGLINLRGSIIPVVDLRLRFGLTASDSTEDTRIVVIEVGSRTIGIFVDAVHEVLRISQDQIEPPPSSISTVEQEYITGLVKLEDKLLILLAADALLTTGEDAAAESSEANVG